MKNENGLPPATAQNRIINKNCNAFYERYVLYVEKGWLAIT